MASKIARNKAARKKYAPMRVVKASKIMRSRSMAHANCANCGMTWPRGQLIAGIGECCDDLY